MTLPPPPERLRRTVFWLGAAAGAVLATAAVLHVARPRWAP